MSTNQPISRSVDSGLLGALQSYLEVSWHFGYRKPKASYAPAVCLVAFGKHEEASPEVAYGRGACEQNHDIVVDHVLPNEEADQKSGKGRSPVGFTPSSRPYSPECLEGEFCELRVDGVLGTSLPASYGKDSHVAYVSPLASLLECPRSIQSPCRVSAEGHSLGLHPQQRTPVFDLIKERSPVEFT